jgi:hypothetical protein
MADLQEEHICFKFCLQLGNTAVETHRTAIRSVTMPGVGYSCTYNQQDATLCNIIYYCQCCTCFRRFLRPLSGAQNCTHSIWYMSSLLAATASVGAFERTHASSSRRAKTSFIPRQKPEIAHSTNLLSPKFWHFFTKLHYGIIAQ